MTSKFLSKSDILEVDLEFLGHPQVGTMSTSSAEMFMLPPCCLLSLCSFFHDYPFVSLLVGEKCDCWCFLAQCYLEDFIKCILCSFSPFFT